MKYLMLEILNREANLIMPLCHYRDDVIQEVFLKYINLNWEPKNKGAWARRVLINSRIDFIRKWSRQSVRVADEMGPLVPKATVPTPFFIDLEQEMKNLPEKLSEVFRLRYFEGWREKTISKHLGKNRCVVSRDLYEARKLLRVALKEYRAQ